MSGSLGDWTLVNPPSGEALWTHGGETWVSTGDALWETTQTPRMWTVEDVDAVVADGDAVLVRSGGVRQRLDRPPTRGRVREGLHRSARWTLRGWQIADLALPYGARWSSSLMPTATGFAAVWTTSGQHFECTALGVRAVRERNERWWRRTDTVPQTWAVAQDGPLLWGPGGQLWDLRTGEGRPLPGWTGGVAAARGHSAVVINALTGNGARFDDDRATHTFAVPLRRDVAATARWSQDGPVLTTELGKQFVLDSTGVRKLPGRVDPVPAEGPVVADLGIAVDGLTRVGDSDWAWRQDGLLLRRRGLRSTV